MVEQQVMKQLENMLNRMSASQKDKLNHIVGNENALKEALSKLDSQQAQQTVKKLHVDDKTARDMDQIIQELKKNPELVKMFNKKM